jgi:protein-tyrosine phosphatase
MNKYRKEKSKMQEKQTTINSHKRVKVLFVCMGNICRSPTAHGVFRHLVQQAGLEKQIEIDSAGTHAYHVGEPADKRSSATAKQRGIDLSDLRARQVTSEDLYEYDYVLAMDNANLAGLLALSTPDTRHKIQRFLSYSPELTEQEVPDPYYGGTDGFNHVFDLVQTASEALLRHIQEQPL